MNNFKPQRTNYGWIVVDQNGKAVEPLTPHYNLPFYRSEAKAQARADQLNRESRNA